MTNKIIELQKQIAELQKLKNEEIRRLRNVDTTNMNKTELIAYAKTLPEIPDHLWHDMHDYGFVTGSSVFSNLTHFNDIDYVCNLPANAFFYANCAVSCSPLTADYIDDVEDSFTPIYACRNNQLYNIICVGSMAKFDAWKATTVIMKELSNEIALSEAFKTKWKRVRVFRALCDVLEPVKPLYEQRDKDEALKYSKCRSCGREAINFTCKATKDAYKNTAICERCQEATK